MLSDDDLPVVTTLQEIVPGKHFPLVADLPVEKSTIRILQNARKALVRGKTNYICHAIRFFHGSRMGHCTEETNRRLDLCYFISKSVETEGDNLFEESNNLTDWFAQNNSAELDDDLAKKIRIAWIDHMIKTVKESLYD